MLEKCHMEGKFKWLKLTDVNVSPMSPKLVHTYPYKVENWGITMAPLFLRLISWKSPPQSIKIFVKLDFFTNALVVWLFGLFFITLEVSESNSWLHQKRSNILVLSVAKMWILNWSGRTFSWHQSQK
jgi:hypothetical protein